MEALLPCHCSRLPCFGSATHGILVRACATPRRVLHLFLFFTSNLHMSIHSPPISTYTSPINTVQKFRTHGIPIGCHPPARHCSSPSVCEMPPSHSTQLACNDITYSHLPCRSSTNSCGSLFNLSLFPCNSFFDIHAAILAIAFESFQNRTSPTSPAPIRPMTCQHVCESCYRHLNRCPRSSLSPQCVVNDGVAACDTAFLSPSVWFWNCFALDCIACRMTALRRMAVNHDLRHTSSSLV